MSDNVVSLFGGEGPAEDGAAKGPVEGLVAELERLLAAARAGEIVGFAGAYQFRTDTVGYSYAGAVGGFAMLGGLECVRLRLARNALERSQG